MGSVYDQLKALGPPDGGARFDQVSGRMRHRAIEASAGDEVFRRTKGDLVRVCVVERQKPLPAFVQNGPWRLERIASRAELELPDLEARIQQLGYYLFTAPEGRLQT